MHEATSANALPPLGLAPSHDVGLLVPLATRLVHKLDTVIHGLQDRIAGLEDNLIPQLSRWLEQKDIVVSEQDVTISHLKDEITELKRIVDFGTGILSRCREREWEVWLTLLDIQRKREEKRGPLVRVFSRTRPNMVRNTEGDSCSTPEDCAAQSLSSAGTSIDFLKKKELAALLLMAKQNVELVDEDTREMAEWVQAYLVRNNGTEGDERLVEEPWRDV